MKAREELDVNRCPKCGGELVYASVPRGGGVLWCTWCERMYYNPSMREDEVRREFMELFGDLEEE